MIIGNTGHIVLFIIGIIAMFVIGGYLFVQYVRYRRRREFYLFMNHDEWLDDNDMIPLPQDDHKKNESSTRPVQPSNTPLSNAAFFDRVNKARQQTNKPQ